MFKYYNWVYAVQERSVLLQKDRGIYPFSVWSNKHPRYFHILSVDIYILNFEPKNLDQNITLHLVLVLIYICLMFLNIFRSKVNWLELEVWRTNLP